MSRRNKKKIELDVSSFMPLVEEALRAFGNDVSYAVAMSKAAVTVERKRNVWKIREQVATAEREARYQCEAENFTCQVSNPCGTGLCRYAKGELAEIDVLSSGSTDRPSNSTQGSYSMDGVVSCMHGKKLKSTVKPPLDPEED